MTGMWLDIALIAVILHQCYCMDIDCNNMFPESPYRNVECRQKETESQNEGVTCGDDATNIKWTFTYTASGTLSVEFDLLPQSCGCKLYKLDLYVNESVTNAEECTENTTFQLRHSSRSLKILNHNAKINVTISPCGKNEVATFNYIFSGCYMWDIEVERCHVGRIFNNSEPRFLMTEYKKDLLINKIPNIIPRYTTALQELQFSVGYVTRINVTGMDLQIRKCDSCTCTCGHGSVPHWWEMALSTSGRFMCKTLMDMSNKPSCHIANDTIECTIHNITTGYYCVLVEIFDDRCEKDTVWNDKSYCTFNSKIIKVEPALPADIGTLLPEQSTAASYAMVVVVLAIVMVCTCALVLIYRRRKRRTLDSGACSFLKYNFVEVQNLYYVKVEEKHSDDLLKIGSEN